MRIVNDGTYTFMIENDDMTHLAMDGDGRWFAYEGEPFIGDQPLWETHTRYNYAYESKGLKYPEWEESLLSISDMEIIYIDEWDKL